MRRISSTVLIILTIFATSAPAAARHPRMDPRHPWLYVAGLSHNAIDIYDLGIFGAPQIGQITKGVRDAFGIWLDPTGKLYVTNQRAPRSKAGSVTIYSPGATSPSLTLTQELTDPQSVAVAANGDVYVANRGKASGIAVFPAGQATLSNYITSPLIKKPIQDFFDASGDLYFSDPLTGVSVIPAGTDSPVSLGLQGLTQATGIALDPLNGNLFVDDYNGEGAYQMLVYAPGSTSPSRRPLDQHAGYFLTMGRIGTTEFLFDPAYFSNQIYVYKHDGNLPYTVLTVGQNADAVAFKPAGIP
jgi:hypothetical protein